MLAERVKIWTIHDFHDDGDLRTVLLEEFLFEILRSRGPVLNRALINSRFIKEQATLVIMFCPLLCHESVLEVLSDFCFKTITDEVIDHI